MTAVARRDEPPFDVDLAVKGFFKDTDWMFKVGIGGLINASGLVIGMANPLMLPALLMLCALTSGYVLRAMRFRALGVENKLPEWNEWLELIVSGLTWVALSFGFWSLVVGIATLSFMVGMAFSKPNNEHVWLVGILLITIFSGLITSFLTSFLMVNFAIEENLRAGFAIIEVIKRFFRDPLTMLSAWLLAVGLLGASVILPSLTVIGVFFVPSFIFIANVMAADILTQTWLQLDPPDKQRNLRKLPGGTGGGKPDNLPKPSGTKRSS